MGCRATLSQTSGGCSSFGVAKSGSSATPLRGWPISLGGEAAPACRGDPVIYDVPAWLLVHVVAPVLAYNSLVFGSLWITALATYVSSRALRVGIIGSALAVCLFMLAPIHLVEAELHVALSYVAPLPVLLALGILTIERPSLRRGTPLGLGTGACGT
jgi:hypothetical protein